MAKRIEIRWLICAATVLRRAGLVALVLPMMLWAQAQDITTRPPTPTPGLEEPTFTSFSYVARTSRSIVKHVPVGPLIWQCRGNRCSANSLMALGVDACRGIARFVGPILAFSRNGSSYNAAQLASCNEGIRATSPSPPPAPRTACTEHSQCDDGIYCNGTEACGSDHFCQTLYPLPCGDDGIACTFDGCSEDTRSCVHLGPDIDGDGHVDESCTGADGLPTGDDCDDGNPNRYPGNADVCDAIDQDCDPATVGTQDEDLDGYISSACTNGTNAGEDCDDRSAAVHPGATELCNNIDNNCSGDTNDEPTVTAWPDSDRDGYGANTGATAICLIGDVLTTPPTKSLNNFDCNDANARVRPGAGCPP
jgi:hypothetical protein